MDAADFELSDGKGNTTDIFPWFYSCWCPREQLHDRDRGFHLLDTQEVYDETAAERKQLLDRNGQPQQGCKQRVSNVDIYVVYVNNIPILNIRYVLHKFELTQKYSTYNSNLFRKYIIHSF
jgi:hypothetical protein